MQSYSFLSRPLQTFCICKSIFSHQRWSLRCVNNTFYFTQQLCEYFVDFSLHKLIVHSHLPVFLCWDETFYHQLGLRLRASPGAPLWLRLEARWCKLCFLTCQFVCINWILYVRRSKRRQRRRDFFWFCSILSCFTIELFFMYLSTSHRGKVGVDVSVLFIPPLPRMISIHLPVLHLIKPLTIFISSKVMLVCGVTENHTPALTLEAAAEDISIWVSKLSLTFKNQQQPVLF